MKIVILIRKRIPWEKEEELLSGLPKNNAFTSFRERVGISFFQLRKKISDFSISLLEEIEKRNENVVLISNKVNSLDSSSELPADVIDSILLNDPDIIIPIDDDDFLSFELIRILSGATTNMMPVAKYVIWPSLELSYVEGWSRASCFLKRERQTMQTVLPSSYGVILTQKIKDKLSSSYYYRFRQEAHHSRCEERSHAMIEISDLMDCRKFSDQFFRNKPKVGEVVNLDYGGALAFRPYTLATEYYLIQEACLKNYPFSIKDFENISLEHPCLLDIPESIQNIIEEIR